ncbi:hypothetical protein CEXT_814481 [Caerostris extrusa]|uniref:Uncharacterized protein n=1 Tax=Caerostris extrusa TaxID=172846 RepID=A0AAV4N9D6_CAEEX|nr:hypothetical protein CEXT_814481 [Caerostris extrusa]
MSALPPMGSVERRFAPRFSDVAWLLSHYVNELWELSLKSDEQDESDAVESSHVNAKYRYFKLRRKELKEKDGWYKNSRSSFDGVHPKL